MLYSYMTKNDFKSNLSFENQLVTGFKSIQYANVFFIKFVKTFLTILTNQKISCDAF